MSAKKKQSTLGLSRTRRNKKHLSKSIKDDSIAKIGGSQEKSLEIHREGLDTTDKLLRDFDLNYAYGPCVGMNRIDRWERAKNLGLNPPEAIKKILVQDISKKYANSLFEEYNGMI